MTAQLTGAPRPVTVTSTSATDSPFRSRWSALAVEAGNPFATPEWHEACLRVEPRVQPVVLGAWRGAELVGVLPLVLRRARGVRVLGLPAAGLADFSAPACAPEDEEAVSRALVDSLVSREQPWDVFRVDRCVVGSAWDEAVRAGSCGRLVVRPWRGSAVLVHVPLLPGQSPLRRGRDRRELDRSGRRLSELHGVEFRMSDEGTVREDVRALLALRRDRLPLAADPTADAFLLEVSLAAAKAGWLRLWSLQSDGRMIAGLLGWSLNGRTFAYVMAFDPAYAQLGPGTSLLFRAVQQAVERGDHTFDFLRGDERHKRPYVIEQRQAHSYLLARSHSRAGLGVRTTALAVAGYRTLPPAMRSSLRARGRPAVVQTDR